MNVTEIYFSPTGGTKKVADALANALSESVTAIDFTLSPFDGHIRSDSLCILAVTSCGGYIP